MPIRVDESKSAELLPRAHGGTVTGSVPQDSARGLSDFSIFSAGSTQFVGTINTGEDGTFRILDLPAGEYTIRGLRDVTKLQVRVGEVTNVGSLQVSD